jgi:hypothetical protein
VVGPASTTVSGVDPVSGNDAVQLEQVAEALSAWHRGGVRRRATSILGSTSTTSPVRKRMPSSSKRCSTAAYVAAMGLLQWLSRFGELPLVEDFSFHMLATRWFHEMLGFEEPGLTICFRRELIAVLRLSQPSR